MAAVPLLALLVLPVAFCLVPEAAPASPPELSPDPAAQSGLTAAVGETVHLADKVVVTYFHRTPRCETCLAFEANAEEALLTAFPNELAGGRLVWSVLDLDDKDNAHFENDYGLTDPSLVVAQQRDGKVTEWKTLPDIWGLVEDKRAFLDYVAHEVRSSLEELAAYERAQDGSADPLPVHGELLPEPDGGGVDAGAPE